MDRALIAFDKNIADARSLTALFDYLTSTLVSPYSFDDILRSQIVYSVSAFDKFLHDLIRAGMMATFNGHRVATPKYHAESISIELYGTMSRATIPPKEFLFEQELIRKLRVLSFQDPDKVAEGLSFIIHSKHKWIEIGKILGIGADESRKRLKLISMRRNAIVHESDIDPITGVKTLISREESVEVIDFLHRCGHAIHKMVDLGSMPQVLTPL